MLLARFTSILRFALLIHTILCSTNRERETSTIFFLSFFLSIFFCYCCFPSLVKASQTFILKGNIFRSNFLSHWSVHRILFVLLSLFFPRRCKRTAHNSYTLYERRKKSIKEPTKAHNFRLIYYLTIQKQNSSFSLSCSLALPFSLFFPLRSIILKRFFFSFVSLNFAL